MSTSLLDALAAGGPEALQTAGERRAELARDVVAAGYLRGAYVLSSGQPSSYYIDKYLFATKPTVLRRLASLLAERVPDVDRIAGPELGSVPITAALSLETGIPFVIVRKARKTSGTSAAVEGELHAGERVLLVEDVVSTAARALGAAAALTETGASVGGVLAVVDREQGGAEAVAASGMPFDALFRLSELPLATTAGDDGAAAAQTREENE